ncbi:hypothetical protein CP863_03975 [Cutibacterium acnes]|uniref:Uncharacterized protein n=1 Tax=Cutibacterium acnes TaxID=1747 RepID=A0AA44U5F0_CUTAC|nr:hypothetical protein DXN06_00780 [Cutibacterium acnes]EFS87433.1 hypothetical protein HMPREF9603_00949 [Cutibacterium acnes HL001PA1]EFT27339.1 hypothetical protein HMPREF9577_00031 [Cutibacterium acnes HL110PA3]PGF24885.1 hypothetical protein B1B02_11590 [Cutibacterium acnes subsp. defendens]PGF32222.1 hypothetical protein B1B11_11625 [Cutibacterium acnes subsp. acnes]QAZ52314.1 hypothetical protein cbac_07215 [Cutibacterium acnes KPA171202]GAE74927.1 hypothetical protein JCM18918_591 [Cu
MAAFEPIPGASLVIVVNPSSPLPATRRRARQGGHHIVSAARNDATTRWQSQVHSSWWSL